MPAGISEHSISEEIQLKRGLKEGAVRVFGCWLGSTHQNGGVNNTKVLLYDVEVVKTILCVLSFGLNESFYSLTVLSQNS